MKYASFPGLLNERSRVLANLNRIELLILGGVYTAFSLLKINGIATIVALSVLIILLKFMERKTQKGFLEQIRGESSLSVKIGVLNE